MPRPIRDKSILITGASSGIGYATAVKFAAQGARLVLAARNIGKLNELAKEIQSSPGQAIVVPADVTVADDVQQMVDAALEAFGTIDILVNNAGIGLFGPVSDIALDDMRALFEINVFGAIRCIQAVLEAMKKQRAGHIINISSVAGKRGVPQMAAYCASKFALNGFSEALRLELEDHGILVSVVCPSYTETPFFDNAIHYPTSAYRKRGRGMTAEQVAAAIVKVARTGQREVTLSLSGKLAGPLNLFFPGLIDLILRRHQKRRFRKETVE